MSGFDSWSDDALRGYVVMLDQFLSGSRSEEARTGYATRLALAQKEIDRRGARDSGRRASVAFPTEQATKDEPRSE